MSASTWSRVTANCRGSLRICSYSAVVIAIRRSHVSWPHSHTMRTYPSGDSVLWASSSCSLISLEVDSFRATRSSRPLMVPIMGITRGGRMSLRLTLCALRRAGCPRQPCRFSHAPAPGITVPRQDHIRWDPIQEVDRPKCLRGVAIEPRGHDLRPGSSCEWVPRYQGVAGQKDPTLLEEQGCTPGRVSRGVNGSGVPGDVHPFAVCERRHLMNRHDPPGTAAKKREQCDRTLAEADTRWPCRRSCRASRPSPPGRRPRGSRRSHRRLCERARRSRCDPNGRGSAAPPRGRSPAGADRRERSRAGSSRGGRPRRTAPPFPHPRAGRSSPRPASADGYPARLPCLLSRARRYLSGGQGVCLWRCISRCTVGSSLLRWSEKEGVSTMAGAQGHHQHEALAP